MASTKESIWFNRPNLEILNGQISKATIDNHLGIKYTEVGDDFVRGTMPADKRTFQPFGVVHGGANVVLAESLGSLAGAHVIDISKNKCQAKKSVPLTYVQSHRV